jgi:hypothetical protein
MAMLDNKPVLRERLMAFGAFAGIGIGAIAAVDVLVTGGFDFGAGRAPYDREQPSAYVRVVEAAQSFGDSVRSVSWDDPLNMNADAAPADPLVGADDGAPPPETMDVASNEQLHREIEALYSMQDDTYIEEPSYEDAAASDDQNYEEPSYEDDEEPEAAIVYENASPW